ncbi:MAG TPA: hypothetical protein VHG53_00140 [Candidatus Limnocylindria bacterium]|nr:hypothetical protein [Candidatus Limnocylindria bacterium]
MRLQKVQRNAILKAVTAGELDANECTFYYDDGASRVTHEPSKSYVLLVNDSERYIASALVGEGPPSPAEACTWITVEDRVRRWAEEVKRDVDTPDLWADLLAARGSRLIEGVPGRAENSPFTPAEQEQLRVSIVQIHDYVLSAFELSGEQRSDIEGKLDYLITASKRVGRIDWKNIAVSVLVSTAVEVARDPAQLNAFLNFCATALADLVMHLPQLPIR